MTERRSPTLRRRRLSSALRELRAATLDEATSRPLTVTGAEKKLGWSQSKLSRMERGEWVYPSPRDIKDLLDLYGVRDEVIRDVLLGLARDGRQKGWWDEYKGLPPAYSNFISLEAEAKSISGYHSTIFPGLFQTPAYARGLMAPSGMQSEQIEQRVEIRVNRQQLLYGSDALEVVAVLDEAVFNRVIGDPEIMREQFERVRQLASLPNVTVYVVPFAAATNLACHSPFTVMEFPLASDPKAVFIEMLVGDLFVEGDGVREYDAALLAAIGAALDPQRSMDFVNKLV